MPARKKGTHEEINSIKSILQNKLFVLNNALKFNPSYRKAWEKMATIAAMDSSYHCTLTSKTLRKTRITALEILPVPDVSTVDFQLFLPSLAFFGMKMFKTFELKLKKGSLRQRKPFSRSRLGRVGQRVTGIRFCARIKPPSSSIGYVPLLNLQFTLR